MNAVTAAVVTLEVTADELADIIARRQGQFTSEVINAPVAAPSTFANKVASFEGQSRNLRLSPFPLFKVNTIKGQRGVFWVGRGDDGELRLGTIKLTEAGRCYKPGKFAGMFYNSVEALESLNK
jgi:hypothetical protein